MYINIILITSLLEIYLFQNNAYNEKIDKILKTSILHWKLNTL